MKIRNQIHFLPTILILSCMFCDLCDSYRKRLNDDAAAIETSLKTVLNFIKLTRDTEAFHLTSDSQREINKEKKDSPNTEKKNELQNQECSLLPANCADIQVMGAKSSGNYMIYPRKKSAPIQVYCDLQTDGGGWLVFQRRGNFGEEHENFFRNWKEYKEGFGNMQQEFWLGNDYLSILTNQDRMTLRIDLEDYDNTTIFTEYSNFLVGDEDSFYEMSFSDYYGNAGDALVDQNGQAFSTKDNDNEHNCANKYKGGWWFNDCHFSSLNGLSSDEEESNQTCVNWYKKPEGQRCMKKSEMKLRPQYFS